MSENIERKLIGLPAIESSECKILILGTFPSVNSHNSGKYYNHNTNIFWELMFRILSPEHRGALHAIKESEEAKSELLLKNRIALWDIIYKCNRKDEKSSADSGLIDIIHNDFEVFFKAHSKIKTIIFNGVTIQSKFFKNKFGSIVKDITKYDFYTTSDSKFNPFSAFEKLEKWSKLNEILENK